MVLSKARAQAPIPLDDPWPGEDTLPDLTALSDGGVPSTVAVPATEPKPSGAVDLEDQTTAEMSRQALATSNALAQAEDVDTDTATLHSARFRRGQEDATLLGLGPSVQSVLQKHVPLDTADEEVEETIVTPFNDASEPLRLPMNQAPFANVLREYPAFRRGLTWAAPALVLFGAVGLLAMPSGNQPLDARAAEPTLLAQPRPEVSVLPGEARGHASTAPQVSSAEPRVSPVIVDESEAAEKNSQRASRPKRTSKVSSRTAALRPRPATVEPRKKPAQSTGTTRPSVAPAPLTSSSPLSLDRRSPWDK
jgi:hypothetical protein